MSEIIESRGVKIPFDPAIVTPAIERPLRRGKYEGGECLAVERVVGAGDRVLELGTGLGLVSTCAALKEGVGEILTFEANPDLIPVIERTYALNGVAGRVTLVNRVVTRGAAPDSLTFYRRRDFWASSLSDQPEGWVDTVEVGTEDFDAVIARLRPTVIVADIEGAELDLFAGADLSSVRFVVMEIHPRVYGAEGVKRIFDDMSKMGFGYSPKISRGGTVVTFERVGARTIENLSAFDAPAASAPAPAAPAPVAAAPSAPAPRRHAPAALSAGPRVLVPTCMKNEGPYILEWLAYQRVIGVTDFLVFTNDCEDGTDRLLQRLDELGYVRHLPNPATALGSPHFQPIALAYAPLMPEYAAADWVISMDVDEFLNIRVGDGTIPALLAATGEVDVISLSETLFGSGGRERFEPGFVTEQFTRCSSFRPGPRRARRGVKSLLRRGCGLALKNHRPHEGAARGFDGVRWVDGSGGPAPRDFIVDLENGMDCRGRFELAYLNHYPLRSLEAFLLKRDRGDVVVANKQVSRRYWRVRNLHDETDESILRHRDAARAEVDRMMADPEVARLHAASIDWHRQRVEALRRDPDYVAFMEELRELDQPAAG